MGLARADYTAKAARVVTPERVHEIARARGVPNDTSAHGLRAISKRLTGKAHLDDMTPQELRKVALALVCSYEMSRKERAERIKAWGLAAGAVKKAATLKRTRPSPLTKTSADALSRRLVAELERHLGRKVAKSVRSDKEALLGLAETAKSSPRVEALSKQLFSTPGTMTERYSDMSKELNTIRQGGLDQVIGKHSPVARDKYQAIKERELVLRRTTGRHRPRPHETVIPGTLSADLVHTADRARGPFMFRGNAPRTPEFLASRHPDVAAGYAIDRSIQQFTPGDKKLLVYKRRDIRGVGEGPADTRLYPFLEPGTVRTPDVFKARHKAAVTEGGPFLWDDWVEQLPRVRRMRVKRQAFSGPAGTDSRRTRHYEDLIRTKPGVTPVAEFRVRPVRLSDGMPGYGLTHVRGAQASDLGLPSAVTGVGRAGKR